MTEQNLVPKRLRLVESADQMTKILITGTLGQIGTELIALLRGEFGKESVVGTDVRKAPEAFRKGGPFAYLDVTDQQAMTKLVVEHDIDWIVHNASILSVTGEKYPSLAMKVNARGFETAIEVAKQHGLRILAPSSIAAFGPSTPRDNTPDETIMRPTTMYGVTKVFVELLGDYYHQKWGVDFRSLRYPGIISSAAAPGGGTTDYAVSIFYDALISGEFTSFLEPDAKLPMMYMPDCLKGTIGLLKTADSNLEQRTFNLGAISFSPAELVSAIQRHIPEFVCNYEPDYRQEIADSWPRSLDDSEARRQWNWQHDYDLDTMVQDMLEKLSVKLNRPFESAVQPQ